MTRRLENKVALVTGGSSGLGRASCLAFARERAKVVVSDVNVVGGEETVTIIKKNGGNAVFVKTDVTNETEIKAMVEEAVKIYGRLDIAFNNAGVGGDDFERIMDTNLEGVWLCMKHEIPQMLKQGGGAIVNTSSIVGLVSPISGGKYGKYAYCASKHGVIGLTKVAALEHAKENVRVNAVCPGFLRTPFVARMLADKNELDKIVAATPMGRVGEPEEVAEAVVWLCSDAASYVTGIAMPVDGGYTAW